MSRDFKRVKHPLFGEYSARNPDPAAVEILDKPAVDRNGHPLPAKPKVSVASKAAANKNEVASPTAKPEEGSK